MSGYTKLFHTILASTIWEAPDYTRLVWITMLAMADRYGEIEASVPGLAKFARVPIEQCQKALTELSAPDAFSRTSEYEGRRIEQIEGGWVLLNYDKYRIKMSQDDKRERDRIRQAERRRRLKVASVTESHKKSQQAEEEGSLEGSSDTDTRAPDEPSWKHLEKKTSTLHNGRVARSRSQQAWCGRVDVPHILHDEFCRKHGTLNADEILRGWYPTVIAKYEGKPIGDDAFTFWRNEFAAWAGTVTTKPAAQKGMTDQEKAEMDRKYR